MRGKRDVQKAYGNRKTGVKEKFRRKVDGGRTDEE
jgi:hypothetical protein